MVQNRAIASERAEIWRGSVGIESVEWKRTGIVVYLLDALAEYPVDEYVYRLSSMWRLGRFFGGILGKGSRMW
jgi:hypothetical protein